MVFVVAGGSETTGKEEAWGGSADPTTPNIHFICKYSGCANFSLAVCNVYIEQPSAYAQME